MTSAALIFGATFVVVFALGIQSLNVNGGHKLMAALTSIAISASNLVLFKVLPGPTDALQIVGYFAGGVAGILSAMAAHPHLVRRFKREAPTPAMRVPVTQTFGAPEGSVHDTLQRRSAEFGAGAALRLHRDFCADLLHPEALGHQATPEIRERAAQLMR